MCERDEKAEIRLGSRCARDREKAMGFPFARRLLRESLAYASSHKWIKARSLPLSACIRIRMQARAFDLQNGKERKKLVVTMRARVVRVSPVFEERDRAAEITSRVPPSSRRGPNFSSLRVLSLRLRARFRGRLIPLRDIASRFVVRACRGPSLSLSLSLQLMKRKKRKE